MFLRRQGIQPNVIDDMHLYDILLEIMMVVDPAYQEDDRPEKPQGDGRIVVHPKPGQTVKQAMREAGYL